MKKPEYFPVYGCYGGAILAILLDVSMISLTRTWNEIDGFLKYLDAFLFYGAFFLLIAGTIFWHRVNEQNRLLMRWKSCSLQVKGMVSRFENDLPKEDLSPSKNVATLTGTFHTDKNRVVPFSLEITCAKTETPPEYVEIYYNEADPDFYLAEYINATNHSYISGNPKELLQQCGISTKRLGRFFK